MLRVVEQYSLTDVGRQRSANEDALFEAGGTQLFAVADGMGGARAGEVAAKAAVDALAGLADSDSVGERELAAAVEQANRRIFELSQGDESLSGMGTTMTTVAVGDGDIAIAHVGDSRAYRLRDGELEKLTNDHSLVDELVRAGKITPEEAEVHPQRSIITRALGPEADVEVERMTYPARAGDVYLICSDGLTTMVPEDAVGAILRGRSSLKQAATELVQAANEAGGRDNVTVVMFKLGEEGEAGQDVESTMGAGETEALRSDEVQAAVAAAAEREPETARDATMVFGDEQTRQAARGSRGPSARPRRPAQAASPLGHGGRGHARCACRERGLLGREPPVLLRRHRRPRPRRAVPRPALRAARSGSSCGRRSTRPACRRGSSPRAAVIACSTTACAARATPPTWSNRSSAASWRTDAPRPLARALQPDPRLAARDGRLHRRADHALGVHRRGHDHLRPLLPRMLRVRAPLHPRAASGRRPLPVPAGGGARRDRAGDDLPDRRGARARAGAVVRRRPPAVRRDDRVPARPPRARALPLHDRGRRPGAPLHAAPAGDRRAR